jgi:hypothetical protein
MILGIIRCRSTGNAGNQGRLVGATLVVYDHFEPVGRIDHRDQIAIGASSAVI